MMIQKRLIVDMGNTRLKYAVFQGDTIVSSGEGIAGVKKVIDTEEIVNSILASVAGEEKTREVLEILPNAIRVNNELQFPIRIAYKTPDTLGVDRIANAVAGVGLFPDKNVLVVDAGTCLKFDFVSDEGMYLGGAISPGLRMRFRAMNDYTANLPLIESWERRPLIGQTTEESLVSGALNGMQNEILATIKRYQELYTDLRIFVTGGDMKYFDFEVKNPIFAHENLTLLGLKLILEANA